MDETQISSDSAQPDTDQQPTTTQNPPIQQLTDEMLQKAKKVGAEIDEKYLSWRTPRRSHELQWFITAAYINGQHTTEAIRNVSTVTDLTKIDKRKKNIANKLWAKHRARYAKFAKTRPKPIVVPFNNDRKSRLDARASEHALDYQYERLKQEQKYLDAVQWAARTGKSYWWFHWDPKAVAHVQTKNEITGTVEITDSEQGDISLEVDSAFSILVPDQGRVHVGDQDEIMRVRVMPVKEMQALYPAWAEHIKPDAHLTSPFEFERQIANLSGSEAGALASVSSEMKGAKNGVLVKEHYTKPNSEYEQGRQIVVMSGLAVKDSPRLPFGFYDMDNPYPCVEFMDMPSVGQFYCGTFAEQLIPLQRGYNMLRDKLEAQIRLNIHPKWLVAKQARIPKASLTNEAGEVVEWFFIPGMPEPKSITPGNIAPDAWRMAQLYVKEFDDISQLQPAFEGKAGTAKSGLQTSLLQEASDNVHSPDARGFELAVQDAAYKMRRMMKIGYDTTRLLSFSGRSNAPEVFEFSTNNIDEHATIVVQIGSALSQFKATKIQQLIELHEKGLLGDPNDPELKRRVLSMLDIGGLEQFQEEARMDEDQASLENIEMLNGGALTVPWFYENHLVHYNTHINELKAPGNKLMSQEVRRIITMHVVLHMNWINPVAAYNLATKYGFQELIDEGLVTPPPPPTLPAMAAQATPPPVAGPAPVGPPPVGAPGPV